jgi:hypothetical protein
MKRYTVYVHDINHPSLHTPSGPEAVLTPVIYKMYDCYTSMKKYVFVQQLAGMQVSVLDNDTMDYIIE